MKWLQFILDNAWTVVIIGGVLFQLLQAITRKKVSDEPAEEQPKEYEFEDPELAERTRKIREEIQRKIGERTRGQAAAPDSAATPSTPPPLIREVPLPRTAVPAAARLETQRQAEILEQQAALMEQLRNAEQMKAAALKRTQFEVATADHSVEAQVATRSTLLDELSSPAALRRAFILREVLGPPAALKR